MVLHRLIVILLFIRNAVSTLIQPPCYYWMCCISTLILSQDSKWRSIPTGLRIQPSLLTAFRGFLSGETSLARRDGWSLRARFVRAWQVVRGHLQQRYWLWLCQKSTFILENEYSASMNVQNFHTQCVNSSTLSSCCNLMSAAIFGSLINPFSLKICVTHTKAK